MENQEYLAVKVDVDGNIIKTWIICNIENREHFEEMEKNIVITKGE